MSNLFDNFIVLLLQLVIMLQNYGNYTEASKRAEKLLITKKCNSTFKRGLVVISSLLKVDSRVMDF